MKGFIEFISDPAWWSVIFTAISTVAVIVIAVVQIRLQKRQAALQAYESYKSTYELLLSIQATANLLIHKVAHYFDSDLVLIDGKKWIDETLEKLQDLYSELHSNEPHIELLLSQLKSDNVKCNRYSLLIHAMFLLVEHLERTYEEGKVISLNDIDLQCVAKEGSDYLVQKIQQELDNNDTNNEPLKSFNKTYQLFIKCWYAVKGDGAILSIREKCKID